MTKPRSRELQGGAQGQVECSRTRPGVRFLSSLAHCLCRGRAVGSFGSPQKWAQVREQNRGPGIGPESCVMSPGKDDTGGHGRDLLSTSYGQALLRALRGLSCHQKLHVEATNRTLILRTRKRRCAVVSLSRLRRAKHTILTSFMTSC